MSNGEIICSGIDEGLDSDEPVVEVVSRVGEGENRCRKPFKMSFRHILNGKFNHRLTLFK